MLTLTYYNDGKEKFQSHEVSIRNETEYGLEDYDFADVIGYGENYEEAYAEFKEKFKEKYEILTEFAKLIFNENDMNTINKVVKVDYGGRPIE